MVNFVVQTATRIALAAEASANNLALLFDALTPEAKQRALDIQQQAAEARRRIIEAERVKAEKRDRSFVFIAGVGLLALALAIAANLYLHI